MNTPWLRLILNCACGFLMLDVAIARVAYEGTSGICYDFNNLNGSLRDIEVREDVINDSGQINNKENEHLYHLGGNSSWNKLSNNSFDKLVQSPDGAEDEITCCEIEEYYFQNYETYLFNENKIVNHSENASYWNTFFDQVNTKYNISLTGDFVVPKCCRKGEQFDSRIARCISRPGHAVENIKVELLDLSNNLSDAYWTKFSAQGISYIAVYNKHEELSFLGPILLKRIVNESEVHLLSRGNITYGTNHISKCNISQSFNIHFPDFCFDAVESGPFAPHVFVTILCDSLSPCIGKCCHPGEMLSKEGLCVPKSETNSFYVKDIRDSSDLLPYSHAPCMGKSYDVADISWSDNYMIKLSFWEYFYKIESHDLKMRCVDWQEAGDGVVKKVLGTCSLLSNVKLLLSVRPLGIVTVLLLGAAIVVTITRAEMRRSAHGRALANHAFCLMAANSMQVAAFYAEGDDRCSRLVLNLRPSTYFFLIAGNAWLSSMTLNMLLSFRQPLGALASAGRRAHSEMRKRYVLMSVFSWGIATALTAFTTYMLENFQRMEFMGYYTPTFGETRICVVDVLSSRNKYEAGAIPMGPLLYFYVPVGLLVLINLLCVIFVIWKMRQLKRGKKVLHGTHIGSRQSTLKNALVYLKLLLMAGLVELCLEVSSWTRRYSYDEYVFDIEDQHILENAYILSITATFVDLSRAVIVLWLCIRQGQKVVCLCKQQRWLDMWKRVRKPVFCETVCGSNDLKERQDTYL